MRRSPRALWCLPLLVTCALWACDDTAGNVTFCNESDPLSCPDGQVCVAGVCAETPDGFVPDVSLPDGTATPDLAPDSSTPEVSTPDMSVPDGMNPDMVNPPDAVGDMVAPPDMAADMITPPDMVSDMTPDMVAPCGDGTWDAMTELCDIAIPAGMPGACPTAADCMPADACESTTFVDDLCQTECQVVVETMCANGDGCCASGCDSTTDDDCSNVCGNSVVEANEDCDTGIAAGMMGACPDAMTCTTSVACESATLSGANCNTVCDIAPVTTCSMASDGCCPATCNANTDADCSPVCGNGEVEMGELCDSGIMAGAMGACPDVNTCVPATSCDTATLMGMGCQATCAVGTIIACSNGDGCCPSGCAGMDTDCAAVCGDGILDMGEQCDTGIMAGNMGACPDMNTCMPINSCNTAAVTGTGCDAICEQTPITTCTSGDGCCATGCTFMNDTDCSGGCGDGVLDMGELCDTAIAAGNAGACPDAMTCTAANSCETANITGTGCQQACDVQTITTCANGDGCCAAGCNANNDDSCSAVCGNGAWEQPDEQCDTTIAAGMMGACPDAMTCAPDPMDACSTASITGAACDQVCTRGAISACVSGDGCCPSTCSNATDSDCTGVPPTFYTFTDLDLRDPHIFIDIVGCRDLTDTGFFVDSINDQIATAIQNDDDMDGLLDLSLGQLFEPLDMAAVTATATSIGAPLCDAPYVPAQCGPDMNNPFMATTYTTMSGPNSVCLEPRTGTTSGYTPAPNSVQSTNMGGGRSCYVTALTGFAFNIAGVIVPLTDAQIAAQFDGTDLVDGLVMGFLSEADADALLLPASLLLVGGQPLSSLLPGGTGNCDGGDDRDVGPDGMTMGWWFYLDFTASQTTWTGP